MPSEIALVVARTVPLLAGLADGVTALGTDVEGARAAAAVAHERLHDDAVGVLAGLQRDVVLVREPPGRARAPKLLLESARV